jgi:hypothetical protein
MIKLENTEVLGLEHAIRGMRNPMNSWDKSDSGWNVCSPDCASWEICDVGFKCPFGTDGISKKNDHFFKLGKADLKLMTRLRNAGTDHRKFMRMIAVYVDITAPLYWWKEFDAYKVGTVANSCSTMHKIHAKKFTPDDFSFDGHEDLEFDDEVYVDDYGTYMKFDELAVTLCEYLRCKYLKTNDKRYWRYLIQLLPTSYNQKRTVMLNYEVLANMYHSRKDHKLDEWHDLCHWIENLPYSQLITGN